MRPLQAKFGKICQWTKKIKDAVVYGWNRQIFPKSPKENRNSLNKSTACLFKKIDGQYAFTGKHHCLQKRFIFFTQEFSLVVWLHLRLENEPPKKLVSAVIFGSFGPTKKKIRSSATHDPCDRKFNCPDIKIIPTTVQAGQSVYFIAD